MVYCTLYNFLFPVRFWAILVTVVRKILESFILFNNFATANLQNPQKKIYKNKKLTKRETDRHQTDRQRETEREGDRETQRDRERDRERQRQWERQRETDRQRQTETDRERQRQREGERGRVLNSRASKTPILSFWEYVIFKKCCKRSFNIYFSYGKVFWEVFRQWLNPFSNVDCQFFPQLFE